MAEIDAVVEKTSQSRIDFVREALQTALQQQTDKDKVLKFVKSYERLPQQPEEYQDWTEEQVWDNK